MIPHDEEHEIGCHIQYEIGGDLDRKRADGLRGVKSRLALLQRLEASLAGSQRAVIALDLAAIERGTSDQRALCRILASEIRRVQTAGNTPEYAKRLQELRRWEWKVLHAARLQAALLKRAQHKLLVMANTLAGPQRNYARPVDHPTGWPFAVTPVNRG